MIRETALMLTDPFLIAREQAEDLFDHRFQDAERDCESCERGWIDLRPGWVRCGKCQGGTIYFLACVKCSQDENGCECSVSSFM